jgi:3-dehydroquinate synthase
MEQTQARSARRQTARGRQSRARNRGAQPTAKQEKTTTLSTRIEATFSICHQYGVVFERGLLSPENDTLAKAIGTAKRTQFFVDQGVLDAWPDLPAQIQAWCDARPDDVIFAGVEPIIGGEAAKNQDDVIDLICDAARRAKICRHSTIVAIGGGAVLDAVGFAASIYHRGCKHVRIPTTVLSQNDSGVGVKNGVNRFGIKNFYGAFAPPAAVLCDLDFLRTLDDRTWISGVAESFKVAAIRDGAFLERLLNGTKALREREPEMEREMVVETARLHIEHICRAGDPFESGSSRPLDFGHWAAHKLESMTNFDVLHGEAVGIGLALDVRYAVAIGKCDDAEGWRFIEAMKDCGLPVTHPYMTERFDNILEGLEEFREHLGGELTLAMPDQFGSQCDIHEVDHDLMKRCALEVAERYA